jgi:hypothetical protein
MPQPMDKPARAFIGYPAGFAAVSGNLAIQAGARLGDDQRQSGCNMFEKGLVQATALLLENSNLYLHSSSSKKINATSVNPRIRIVASNHHSGYPCPQDGFRARRSTTVMIAWFKGHVQGGVFRLAGGIPEGVYFSMGIAGPTMISSPNHLPFFHHHRAHHWIGRCSSHTSSR